jgi:sensor c-di-GMP phosphodiesterase-like protein
MLKVRIFFVRPFLRLNTLLNISANYKRKPDVAIYYYRDTPFFTGYKMTYMQRGNYVVVVNPLSYSEVMSNDHSLSWGVYDTVTNAFFSVSQKANVSLLNSMIRHKESVFQKDDRFYTIVNSEKRPIAAIVSTSNKRFYETLYHQATLTLPLGMICSIIILLVWSRTHRELNSPGRLLHRALNKRQLCVHYQPIIDIKNNRCVGAEALLRWPGFNGQVMSPAEFIPLAEKEG